MTDGGALLTQHTVLYGGSFDPPHLGHQMACLTLLEGLGAKVVWMLPSYNHPFGKPLTIFKHRVAMCRLAAASFGNRVEVHETERTLGGMGRTYDLLVHLQNHYPHAKFALAIGADLVCETPRWHRWQAIKAATRLVVLGRAGYPQPADTPPLPPIASHKIRAAAACGDSFGGSVCVAVARYMVVHKLYV